MSMLLREKPHIAMQTATVTMTQSNVSNIQVPIFFLFLFNMGFSIYWGRLSFGYLIWVRRRKYDGSGVTLCILYFFKLPILALA